MPPEGSNFILTTNIPHRETNVLVFNCFHIKTYREKKCESRAQYKKNWTVSFLQIAFLKSCLRVKETAEQVEPKQRPSTAKSEPRTEAEILRPSAPLEIIPKQKMKKHELKCLLYKQLTKVWTPAPHLTPPKLPRVTSKLQDKGINSEQH